MEHHHWIDGMPINPEDLHDEVLQHLIVLEEYVHPHEIQDQLKEKRNDEEIYKLESQESASEKKRLLWFTLLEKL